MRWRLQVINGGSCSGEAIVYDARGAPIVGVASEASARAIVAAHNACLDELAERWSEQAAQAIAGLADVAIDALGAAEASAPEDATEAADLEAPDTSDLPTEPTIGSGDGNGGLSSDDSSIDDSSDDATDLDEELSKIDDELERIGAGLDNLDPGGARPHGTVH